MSEESKPFFRLIKKTTLANMAEGDTISSSDLCLQDDNCLYQFKYIDDAKPKQTIITPGFFVLEEGDDGLYLNKAEYNHHEIVTDVINTQLISNEIGILKKKMESFKKRKIDPVRKVLCCSKPGQGKTAALLYCAHQEITTNPGCVVIVWPTSSIKASRVASFFNNRSVYDPSCNFLIFLMEDIGGLSHEGHSGPRHASPELLEILEGVRKIFKLPTVICATTNYPENLPETLGDRYGRFDTTIELQSPNHDNQLKILEFYLQRPTTEEEKQAMKRREVRDFSIAHIKKIGIDSDLYDKTVEEMINDIINHRKRFKNNFESQKKSNFGFGIDDN
jgi:hypothetical protein